MGLEVIMKKQFISFYDKAGDFVAIPVALNPLFFTDAKNLKVDVEFNQMEFEFYLDHMWMDSLIRQLSEV
jgi:hypothetical protein